MAEILPISTKLNDVKEYDNVRMTFQPQLEAGETLISINIIDRTPNDGISVEHSTYFGQYINSFNLGSDAIKVRLRLNGELKSYSSWGDLPPPESADIFEFKAPSVLTTDYSYTVKMVYEYTSPTAPSLPVKKEITKSYTQTVFGDYSIWAKQLRNYVSQSGHFPNQTE